MAPRQNKSLTRAAGFSVIELVVVMGLIIVVVAISLPAIARFIRNYRIRGAMDQVASEVNFARTMAISKNANPGVVFVVGDNNSYRWILEGPGGPQTYGPLRDLPQGVQFAAGVDTGFRFNSLGTWCRPAVGECIDPAPAACLAADAAQCGDAPGLYVTSTAVGSTINLVEVNTGVARAIQIAPGGRVRVDPR